MTALSLSYHKEIIPADNGAGRTEYDARLNGVYIGTFPTRQHAERELDAVAYEDARRSPPLDDAAATERVDLLPPANPLVPFGVPGGPTPQEMESLTPADIGRAAEELADFYERHPAVVKRIISAHDYALAALTDHQRAEDAQVVRVRDNGDIAVRGSKVYWVSDNGCTCPDYRHLVYGQKYAGSGAESGLCKHALCREILRLAQARRAVGNATNGNPTAFAALPAAALARALTAATKGEIAQITIDIACYRARIVAGDIRKEVVSEGQEGWGFRALTISRAAAADLARELAAFAKAHAGISVTLMLDGGASPEIAVFADSFARNVEAKA